VQWLLQPERQADVLDRLKHAGARLYQVCIAQTRTLHRDVLMLRCPKQRHVDTQAPQRKRAFFDPWSVLVEDCQKEKSGWHPAIRLAMRFLRGRWVHGHRQAGNYRSSPLPRGQASVMKFSKFVIDQSLPRRG